MKMDEKSVEVGFILRRGMHKCAVCAFKTCFFTFTHTFNKSCTMYDVLYCTGCVYSMHNAWCIMPQRPGGTEDDGFHYRISWKS